jgi:hypothetical protein
MVFWKSITKLVELLKLELIAGLTGTFRTSFVVVNVPNADELATPCAQTVAALPTARTTISTSSDQPTADNTPALYSAIAPDENKFTLAVVFTIVNVQFVAVVVVDMMPFAAIRK